MGSRLSEDEIIEITQKLNFQAVLRIFLFFLLYLYFIYYLKFSNNDNIMGSTSN